MISDPLSGHTIVIQCCSRSKGHVFVAEFVLLAPTSDTEVPLAAPVAAPASLTMVREQLRADLPFVKKLMSEDDIACMMVKASPGPWVYHRSAVDDAQTSKLEDMVVESFGEPIDIESEQRDMALRAEALRAMRLLKRARDPGRARKARRARGPRVGVAARAEKPKKADGEPDKFAEHGIAHDDDSVNDDDVESSEEDAAEAHLEFQEEDDRRVAGRPDEPADHDEPGPPPLPPPVPEPEPAAGVPLPPEGLGPAGGPLPLEEERPRPPEEDGPAAEGPGLLPPPEPEPPHPRRLGAADFVEGHLEEKRIETFGSIKIDRKRISLNAHCSCLGRPGDPKDHRTERTPECRMNRSAKKAPIGFLIAWLRDGPACMGRLQHVAAQGRLGADLDIRQRARAWALTQPDLLPLLQYEAEAHGLEVGEVVEPERIQ